MRAPTERFSTRVENYIRFRPGYPAELIQLLQTECGLDSDSIIADIGSGTGKLTEPLLQTGCRVFGIEPNREMREAAERLLKLCPRFTSIAATAEATTLASRSVDLIVAGQAFHWFDRARTRAEFKRILKPDGFVALIWNDRQTDSSPFLRAYERLLREFGTDYALVNHRNVDVTMIREFFQGEPQFRSFPYSQQFDFEGVKGRLLSSSYVPDEGEANCDAMLSRLQQIFGEHQRGGSVSFDYDTLVYYAKLS